MLTVKRCREVLFYNPATGEFRWLPLRGPQYANKPAGRLRRDGYLEIKIDRQSHLSHRLAWLYVHGAWPSDGIDHINGVRSDNCISNLREADNSRNQMNTGIKRSNKSGFKGVSWHKGTKKWRAQIRENGKPVSLGYYDSPCDAHMAYLYRAKKLQGEFGWGAARAFTNAAKTQESKDA